MATPGEALVSTVSAATTGSISAINTIGTWLAKLVSFIDACGSAKDRLEVLQSDFKHCEIELSQWQKKWKLTETTTIRWQQELWGQKTDFVRSKLARILARCSMLKQEFVDFFQPDVSTYLDDAVIGSRSILSRAMIETYRSGVNQNVSTRQIIEFVTKLDTLGTKWVQEMQAWLLDLFETADSAFLDKPGRGEKISGQLTEAQLQAVRASTLMRMAVELRMASEDLCQQLLDAARILQIERRSTKLKIDLTGDKDGFRLRHVHSQETIQLMYHLFLHWDGPPRELCIEGPVGIEVEENANVYSAYIASWIPQSSNILVNDGQGHKAFSSRAPLQTERLFSPNNVIAENSIWEPESLADFLVNLDNLDIDNCMRVFPMSERLSLAFKIVETAVLLAGTTWLSNISSNSLFRSRPRQSEYYDYTIDIKAPDQGIQEIFDRLGAHFFRVGVVLLEIGYGSRVIDYGNNRYDTLEFTFNNGENEPIGSVAGVIQRVLGAQYASMTVFCLKELPYQCSEIYQIEGGEIDTAYQKILESYFSNVYSPIRDLASRSYKAAKIIADSQSQFRRLS